jgi:hypothetical protein
LLSYFHYSTASHHFLLCVWIHTINSWHNVNLVHILGVKTLWPNLTSKKPITKSPTRTLTLTQSCALFLFNTQLQWPNCYFKLPQGKWIVCAQFCSKHNLMHHYTSLLHPGVFHSHLIHWQQEKVQAEAPSNLFLFHKNY